MKNEKTELCKARDGWKLRAELIHIQRESRCWYNLYLNVTQGFVGVCLIVSMCSGCKE